jgi:hypothetical protein
VNLCTRSRAGALGNPVRFLNNHLSRDAPEPERSRRGVEKSGGDCTELYLLCIDFTDSLKERSIERKLINCINSISQLDPSVRAFKGNSIILIILSAYFASLFPLLKGPEKGGPDELRKVIHTLQVLHTNTAASTESITKSIHNTIQTVRNLAGLQTVIVELPAPHGSEPPSILTISLRFPCLPESSYNFAGLINYTCHSFREYQNYYISPHFPPETPPPVIA